MIGPVAADIIGIGGSVIFIAAFAYANLSAALNKPLFNPLNLAGAALLVISLSVHFNFAAVILEIAWAIIAIAGLIDARRARPESNA